MHLVGPMVKRVSSILDPSLHRSDDPNRRFNRTLEMPGLICGPIIQSVLVGPTGARDLSYGHLNLWPICKVYKKKYIYTVQKLIISM